MTNIKLTDFASGGGCGCKISPSDLDKILKNTKTYDDGGFVFPGGSLQVGYNDKDDAAVMRVDENGMCVVSTTDFFMPVVDDPFQFGRISATNAISDIFAMGARPCMGISILGWPLDKLDASIATEVINGAKKACADAMIPLAGGHSIISQEPIFGLAVTGTVHDEAIIANGKNVQDGDLLYLTKPLGVGILAKAAKMRLIDDATLQKAIHSMTVMNSIGLHINEQDVPVTGMTDVTGFGLLGHLVEMTESAAGDLCAEVFFNRVPLLDEMVRSLPSDHGVITGGSKRNVAAYGHKIAYSNSEQKALQESILSDPQTSGGLLIAINEADHAKLLKLLEEHQEKQFPNSDPLTVPVGRIVSRKQAGMHLELGNERVVVLPTFTN